jgi:hypothetical protein
MVKVHHGPERNARKDTQYVSGTKSEKLAGKKRGGLEIGI